MPARHLFVFSRGRHGWSEEWFREPGVVDLDAEIIVALKWAKTRVTLLSNICALDGIRVQDLSIKGSGFLNREGTIPLNSLVDSAPADVRQTGLLCRAEADSGTYKRQVILRGVPDKYIEYVSAVSGFEIFGDWLNDHLNALRAATLSAGYCLSVLSKDVPVGTAPEKNVEDVSYTLAPGFVAIRVAGHGFAQLAPIRIRKARFVGLDPGINGVWNVRLDPLPADEQANWFAVPGLSLLPGQSRYWGNGKVQIRQKILRPVDLFTFERFTHRDTGSAFFRGRGRKRARRRS